MKMLNLPAVFVTMFLLYTVCIGTLHHSIPLKHYRNKSGTTARALHAIAKRHAALSNIRGGAVQLEPMTFGPHDWFYGSFDVGDSKNLSLSIDTASGTLYLNSGLYKPSKKSININRSGESGFGTWFKDGCGSGMYSDRHKTLRFLRQLPRS